MDYLLEVEQVYAGYVQDLYILQGVNFRIAPGELVTVIGPNGAGKSIKSFPSVWVMFPKLLMFFHPLASRKIWKWGLLPVKKRLNP